MYHSKALTVNSLLFADLFVRTRKTKMMMDAREVQFVIVDVDRFHLDEDDFISLVRLLHHTISSIAIDDEHPHTHSD